MGVLSRSSKYDHVPFVTVLMPIRNEAGFIARSLGAVLTQDYPADCMEILVIDGMSTDATRDIIRQTTAARQEETARKLPAVLLLDNPGRIVPTGFNIGLQHAHGEIIVRVDGHCEIAPDYVRRCVELLEETGADNVGGLQRAASDGVVGRAIALATSSPFGVGNAIFHYAEKPGWVDHLFLGAYRRQVFERIGGFDEELVRNQDDEFDFRLVQAGGKIWLDPSIRVVYYNRPSLRKLWRQYFQYGFYKVRVIQKRRAVPSWRHLVPGTFAASLPASLLLTLLTRRPFWALSIAGPYLVVNGLASLWVARKDWPTLPLLPAAYLVLHLSYGIGFLQGLWHWRRKPTQPAPFVVKPREGVMT